MASPSRKSASPSQVQKHRACDECRSRKLACSKEPDGCSRCKREGIQCHYSPQKPMGRPRKRRHAAEASPSRSPPRSKEPAMHDMQTIGFSPPNLAAFTMPTTYASHTDIPLDPSLGFLNQDLHAPNMEFMDLLPQSYTDSLAIHHDPQIFVPPEGPTDGHSLPLGLHGVGFLDGMSFDEPEPVTMDVSKDISDSLQRYMAAQYAHQPLEPPESTPSDFSNSVPSPEPASLPQSKAVPNVNCGCLSSLYLSLDSLTNLPQHALMAMSVARKASKIAHDVISCPLCSRQLNDVSVPPPMQAFQNMMLLAALIPSVCNAYAAILEMIDNEVALAKSEGRNFFFSFKDVGGLWGAVFTDGTGAGSGIEHFNNKTMDPDVWRTIIRAIMRIDIHGFSEMPDCPAGPGARQQGLKDVVTLLDERSRYRHDLMDTMLEAGQMPRSNPYVIFPGTCESVPHEQRQCVRIIDAARTALDNLAIA